MSPQDKKNLVYDLVLMEDWKALPDVLSECKMDQILYKDSKGITPLHLACANDAPMYIVQMLIDSGAHMDALDENGYSPLHVACERNAPLQVIWVLLERGALLVHFLNKAGRTPLHVACASKANWDVVNLLVDRGSVLNAVDKTNQTALDLAKSSGASEQVIRVLLKHGALTANEAKAKL